jgi:hypothetical protein
MEKAREALRLKRESERRQLIERAAEQLKKDDTKKTDSSNQTDIKFEEKPPISNQVSCQQRLIEPVKTFKRTRDEFEEEEYQKLEKQEEEDYDFDIEEKNTREEVIFRPVKPVYIRPQSTQFFQQKKPNKDDGIDLQHDTERKSNDDANKEGFISKSINFAKPHVLSASYTCIRQLCCIALLGVVVLARGAIEKKLQSRVLPNGKLSSENTVQSDTIRQTSSNHLSSDSTYSIDRFMS